MQKGQQENQADDKAKTKLNFWEWQELIIKAPVSWQLKLTYITLRNFDNERGCYPKLATVAERRGVGVRTLKRHIKTLRESEYLHSQQSRGPSHYDFTDEATGKDLLLGELAEINQINQDTTKDVTVSDVTPNQDTTKDVTPNSDTTKSVPSEVTREVTREDQKENNKETGQTVVVNEKSKQQTADGPGEDELSEEAQATVHEIRKLLGQAGISFTEAKRLALKVVANRGIFDAKDYCHRAILAAEHATSNKQGWLHDCLLHNWPVTQEMMDGTTQHTDKTDPIDKPWEELTAFHAQRAREEDQT